ncbi:hypothetical protein BO70DRAFT_365840 [Aspergillus heteromorphus CBS 117.55]|uniref:Uncharacterized protein n=1 Tax=Aspergillus heteromorphus CBS 117.55 TaxID=1448321 RepID=A0A317V957_9EURO|nr:uncharacterized protein BO70DRAFT_365840 [Aspergillus heteromorphus CBS 117.55]PWY69568.1 hypothetical protein BO70DRAFT_365840 [Aspergillus heteromorphus CBS 117.55]
MKPLYTFNHIHRHQSHHQKKGKKKKKRIDLPQNKNIRLAHTCNQSPYTTECIQKRKAHGQNRTVTKNQNKNKNKNLEENSLPRLSLKLSPVYLHNSVHLILRKKKKIKKR